MKNRTIQILLLPLLGITAQAQSNNSNYTNFIRQIQHPYDGVQRDATVDATGQQDSPLEINPGGARFELHTTTEINTPTEDVLESYLLDVRYVASYIPAAEVEIITLDPNAPVPRTRSDKGFTVAVTLNGLEKGEDHPDASKKVSFHRHTQSYPADSDGTDIDPADASLIAQVSVDENGDHTFSYPVTGLSSADPRKTKGEERFSVFSEPDFQAPASQLASQTVQIWPMTEGTLAGITDGTTIKFSTPVITLNLIDIYPSATVFARIYKGSSNPNPTDVAILPGSAVVVNESIPQNRLLQVRDWDSILDSNGQYTIELLTTTVFDTQKLDEVTFTVDRTINVKASFTTME